MDDQGYSVPVEALLAAVEEQRNAALTDAAQMRALARHFNAELDAVQAERDRLAAEIDKLKAAPSS